MMKMGKIASKMDLPAKVARVLGMTKGLVLHNAMQLSIPFVLTAAVYLLFPYLDLGNLFLLAFLGSILPDVDHFSMWRKVKHTGLFNFMKFCVQADRYRKAFLPCHNYGAMAIVAVASVLLFEVNVYASVFFISFFFHLMSDFLADVYLIKKHSHWKIRGWMDPADMAKMSGPRMIQQAGRQKGTARAKGN